VFFARRSSCACSRSRRRLRFTIQKFCLKTTGRVRFEILSRAFTRSRRPHTARAAEAIWRFFLTDGRFVKPGFFTTSLMAYEEPWRSAGSGELLTATGSVSAITSAKQCGKRWFRRRARLVLTGHTGRKFYEARITYASEIMHTTRWVAAIAEAAGALTQVEESANIFSEVDEQGSARLWIQCVSGMREARLTGRNFTTKNDTGFLRLSARSEPQ